MFQIHETGELIRALRKQKELTQEELAEYANIDVATLSKIENGHAMPKQATFRRLLDVLKFDVGEAAHLFMGKEERAYEETMREGAVLLKLMQTKEVDGVNDLTKFLDKIEQDKDFFNVTKNHQWFLNMRCSTYTRLAHLETFEYKKEHGFEKLSLEEQRILMKKFTLSEQTADGVKKAVELYQQALKLTIPKFEIEKISEYYLTLLEISLIGSMAIAYREMGNVDKNIQIYKELAKLKGNKEPFGLSRYPQVVANLALVLNTAERFEEAIEYASEGIAFCITTRNTSQLPKLVNQKALAMCYFFGVNENGSDEEKTRASEIKNMFRYAYYSNLMEKEQYVSTSIKETFAFWFKENIYGTPNE
ncbi:MAG: helix-turn-helix domain-containing protein [Defluviitaleaceae bacterium]|nr:helix-turn-helix domain-containing protein [Defluviitaleaceae bacterium]